MTEPRLCSWCGTALTARSTFAKTPEGDVPVHQVCKQPFEDSHAKLAELVQRMEC